jgi:hypothetical protein
VGLNENKNENKATSAATSTPSRRDETGETQTHAKREDKPTRKKKRHNYYDEDGTIVN